jgi:hypothetical protein
MAQATEQWIHGRYISDVMTLPIIHMFWHGSPFSRVEQLAMRSFLAHGHQVHLYAYEHQASVPPGVERRDANEILPVSSLFRHKGSGSMAMFADWFRYRVLYLHGGVWADTDVVCLKPVVFDSTELYAWEDSHFINVAVLGLAQGHRLAEHMVRCCERPNALHVYDDVGYAIMKLRRRWFGGNRREDVEWGEYSPRGFTVAATHFGLRDRTLPSWHFYPLHYRDWLKAFDGSIGLDAEPLANATTLHLWNEMTRYHAGFDKNASFPPTSIFETLWRRYHDE